MNQPLAVFVDSDVVTSSLVSSSGAASLLINDTKLKLYLSNLSYKELTIVVDRLGLGKSKLEDLIKKRFKIVKLKIGLNQVKEKYGDYVTDVNDAHIVAGAREAKTRFLISYNIRHFKVDKIKADLNIILTTPARFLQYLRSL